MISSPLATPVALLVFNRPAHTARVVAAVRAARPRTVLVIADGPRPGRPDDERACAATREVIAGIDWTDDVRTEFSPVNLGCRRRVASGLDWVFEQVPEAIILEDDCLPEPSFFPFCEALLARFRDDERVMHIGGTNFQDRPPADGASYYFSAFAHIWGWASWRRAWRHYDVAMRAWPEARAQVLATAGDRVERRTMERLYQRVYEGRVDTWDAQWEFACRRRGALAALPAVNLVSNIGFGAGATHTSDESHPASRLATAPLAFPLRHPAEVRRDARADAHTARVFRPSLYRRARSLLARMRERRTRAAVAAVAAR